VLIFFQKSRRTRAAQIYNSSFAAVGTVNNESSIISGVNFKRGAIPGLVVAKDSTPLTGMGQLHFVESAQQLLLEVQKKASNLQLKVPL